MDNLKDKTAIHVLSHILIIDRDTKEILVNKRDTLPIQKAEDK